jgi:hypothetical protein
MNEISNMCKFDMVLAFRMPCRSTFKADKPDEMLVAFWTGSASAIRSLLLLSCHVTFPLLLKGQRFMAVDYNHASREVVGGGAYEGKP